MKVSAHECDGCGTLIRRSTEVYKLTMESVGWIPDTAGGASEKSSLELHFCFKCATHLYNTLKRLSGLTEKEDEG